MKWFCRARLNGRGWKPFYRKEDKEAAAEEDGNVRNHRFGAPMLSGSFGRTAAKSASCKGALCDEKPTFT